MGDWFTAAQRDYDNATPAYLEADDRPCEECGVPGEDHCEDCGDCDCTCDDEEDA